MSPHHCRLRVALAALAACAVGLASAAPISYFDADWGASATIPANSASRAKKNAFLSTLEVGYRPEGFSNLGLNPSLQNPFDVTLWNYTPQTLWSTGSLTPSDYTDPNALLTAGVADPATGRFDTTGSAVATNPSWWFETDQTFTVAFGGAFSAFGFYMTDAADFGGSLSLDLTGQDGIVTTLAVLNGANTPGGGVTNGGLAFFGFTDQSKKYTSASFKLVQATNAIDVFGFDDLVVGNVVPQSQTGVPEPTSIALAGLALLGAALSSRKTST